MSTAAAWTYKAPKHPDSHPTQFYYRAEGFHHIDTGGDVTSPRITLFRFENEADAEISIKVPGATVEGRFSRESLLALRDALNDAIQDIEVAETDRERRESFEAIQDELSQLEDGQSPGCYYAHPDVHYVPADQVAEKVRELEAACAPRYIVLPDPAADLISETTEAS